MRNLLKSYGLGTLPVCKLKLCVLGSSGGDEEEKRDAQQSLLRGFWRISSLLMKVIISHHGLNLAQKYLS